MNDARRDPLTLDIGVFGARGIPSTYSGYETFLTVLLPELASRGHRVTMYCRRGDVAAVPSYGGVRCVHLPAVPGKQFSTLTHGWVAAATARLARHDVLLVVNVANAMVCVATRLSGQRVVLNTDGQEWKRGKWGRMGKAVFLGSAYLARWSAAALIADSVAMRDIYRTQFRADSTVIPYCWTGIVPDAPDALMRLGLEPRGYCLIAGRLNPENNIDTIAAAYLATDASVPLVVLGTANYDSPAKRSLDNAAREDPRLVVAGHVPERNAFASLVAGARLYLHGHSVGGINPSLIEAMGCGARILALDTIFNREALGDAGDYFPSPEQIGPALSALLAESERSANEKRAAARARATTWFALDRVVDAHEALLTTVARKSPWSHTQLPTSWSDGVEAVRGRSD